MSVCVGRYSPPLRQQQGHRGADLHGEESVGHDEGKIVVVEVVDRVALAVGEDLVAQTGAGGPRALDQGCNRTTGPHDPTPSAGSARTTKAGALPPAAPRPADSAGTSVRLPQFPRMGGHNGSTDALHAPGRGPPPQRSPVSRPAAWAPGSPGVCRKDGSLAPTAAPYTNTMVSSHVEEMKDDLLLVVAEHAAKAVFRRSGHPGGTIRAIGARPHRETSPTSCFAFESASVRVAIRGKSVERALKFRRRLTRPPRRVRAARPRRRHAAFPGNRI